MTATVINLAPPQDPPAMASTWAPIPLHDVLGALARGEHVGPIPSIGRRTDGIPLLYPGAVHSLYGEPEAGKGWICLHIAAQVLEDGGRVLFVDFEDTVGSVVGRLLALAVPPTTLLERFSYVRPETAGDPHQLDRLLREFGPFTLAVLDGMTESYALAGLDPDKNPDAAKWLKNYARPIAATGAAVVLIDHVVKSKDNRNRYALGAQHKLAGIDVAYGANVLQTFSRLTNGRVRLIVLKDRPGHIRGHATGSDNTAALVHVEPTEGGAQVAIRIDPPETASPKPGDTWEPTGLMEKISRALEAAPQGLSVRSLLAAIGTGKNDKAESARHLAIELLLNGGHITIEPGPRNATIHRSVHPYRKPPEDRPHTVPTPSPGDGHSDRPTVPHPLGDGDGTHPTDTTHRPPTQPSELPDLSGGSSAGVYGEVSGS